MGPMAQDFHAAFGLGANDVTIATVDADGVALAAIQGLNDKLERENEALKKRLADLEAKDKARDAKLLAIETMLKSMAKPPVQTASLEVGAE